MVRLLQNIIFNFPLFLLILIPIANIDERLICIAAASSSPWSVFYLLIVFFYKFYKFPRVCVLRRWSGARGRKHWLFVFSSERDTFQQNIFIQSLRKLERKFSCFDIFLILFQETLLDFNSKEEFF